MLVAPRFIYRTEEEPANLAPGAIYRVSDVELASRLSFFLWSSIPDDELLNVATKGRLRDPKEFERQVRRMLADPKSDALITNFAGQWLYLRDLANVQTDAKNFDDNLRQAFRRETELFFGAIVREDRSLLDLIDADFTFVDERLARHYGIPNIRGSYFRRIPLDAASPRRGLIGQGEYVDGDIGLHSNVTGLTRQMDSRESPRNAAAGAAAWRRNESGSGCEGDQAGDVAGASGAAPRESRLRVVSQNHGPDGLRAGELRPGRDLAHARQRGADRHVGPAGGWHADSSGVADLRKAILSRSDAVMRTVTAKLMTYALGRPVDYADMPTVRAIVRRAAANDNRFSSVLLGIVESDPFQKRIKKDGQTSGQLSPR